MPCSQVAAECCKNRVGAYHENASTGVAERNKNVPVKDEHGYAEEFVAQIRTHALIGMIIVHSHPLRVVCKNEAMLLLILRPYFPNVLFFQAFIFLYEY